VLDTLLEGGTGVEEIELDAGSAKVGLSLDDAGLLDPDGAHVLALRRRDGTLHVSPPPGLRLQAGDLVVALGSEAQLEGLSSRLS
jgi:K+/H+ antiporter YhaU regulatory subunit KhtT